MRIWDIDPRYLCDKHLLAEHGELHGLWVVLTRGKKGYSQHPETLRWRGKLPALRARHEWLTLEMQERGFNHFSPLAEAPKGLDFQVTLLITIDEQMELLSARCPECRERMTKL